MNILVVVAHPDDEIIGCGGAIANHIDRGDQVKVVILAEGVTSRLPSRQLDLTQNQLSNLRSASISAAHALGLLETAVSHHNFPDNRMDSVDILDITKIIEKYVESFRPERVYTHFGNDLNIDHRIVSQACLTACRPIPSSSVKTILQFETNSSTEWQDAFSYNVFKPNHWIDISSAIEKKLLALKAYDSEMRDWPHSRSLRAIEHLSRWRGASVGLEAAEAFIAIRNIEG